MLCWLEVGALVQEAAVDAVLAVAFQEELAHSALWRTLLLVVRRVATSTMWRRLRLMWWDDVRKAAVLAVLAVTLHKEAAHGRCATIAAVVGGCMLRAVVALAVNVSLVVRETA